MREKLQIDETESMDNGICFYSKRHKDYVAIATIDEQGIISTEWTTIKKNKENEDNQYYNAETIRIFICYLISILFSVIIIKLSVMLSAIKFIYGIRTALFGLFLIFLGSFIIYTIIERKKDLNKFHSAELMVLNAYSKLNRVPTIKEIYQYSPLDNDCITNECTIFIMISFLMFACTFIPDILYQLITMIFVIKLVPILSKCGYLNFVQKLTTITPTNKELLVAIEGMNVWLENEKKEGKI